MAALWEDLTPYLTANGIGAFGTDYFWGTMPDTPNDLLALYDTPGPEGDYTKLGPAGTEGRLQALSRAESYQTAMARALQVYALLDDGRVTLNGTRYHFRALGRPFDVGAQDDAGRTIISTNYAVFIR